MSTDAAVAGLRILPTQHSVAEVLNRVQTRGAGTRDDDIRANRLQRRCRTIRSRAPSDGTRELGNPKGGTPLMVAAPTVAIDLPLRYWPGGRLRQKLVGVQRTRYMRARTGSSES